MGQQHIGEGSGIEQTEVALPRFITNFDTGSISSSEVDVLIVGSGISALLCAHYLSRHTRKILILTKGSIYNCNTSLSQGGIAFPVSKNDSVSVHMRDTLNCGRELCDRGVVRQVISHGKELFKELRKSGFEFDMIDGIPHFAREGGHSVPRILHKGDETGHHLHNFFADRIDRKSVKIADNSFLIDILQCDGTAYGALVKTGGGLRVIYSKFVVIASGGAGRVYRETTNSAASTGDGMAACLRAGAALIDMEFIQFHPTALYIPGAPRKLITEAIRGEGAYIVDNKGERFLFKYNREGELAPRDVISIAISRHMSANKLTNVYLDVRHFSDSQLSRFPSLINTCYNFQIDLKKDLIPIRPAAHYTIGGVRASLCGETNISRLYAIGESSCTGFHGANRLASNSLLECLVMGKLCAEDIINKLHCAKISASRVRFDSLKYRESFDAVDMVNALTSTMLRGAGVLRHKSGITKALSSIMTWKQLLFNSDFGSSAGYELQNMLAIAECICLSALWRKESRGVHCREDYPMPSAQWKKRNTIQRVV